MVFNIEPVAYLIALAIDRQRFAFQGVKNDQRNKFFREVVRAVIVRAVGNQRRQPVGTTPRTH
ncbi:hypothetical protein D3C84_1228180 [compost metagenome]